MGAKSGKNSKNSKKELEPPGLKKYDYRNYLADTAAPSDFALEKAKKYDSTLASSAALQADLEANKSFKRSKSKFRGTNRCVKVLFSLLCILQMAGAGIIIAITAAKLDNDVETAEGVYSKAYCYQLSNSSINTCTYTYWAGGISVAVSLILLIFGAACHGLRGRCCLTIESILSICGAAWWIAAGVVSTITSDNASAAGLGEQSARIALWIVCYVTAGLFGGTMLLSMGGCCFSCCRDTRDDFAFLDE
jgi:hypothetical protein